MNKFLKTVLAPALVVLLAFVLIIGLRHYLLYYFKFLFLLILLVVVLGFWFAYWQEVRSYSTTERKS
ncbi:MAG TPA: hypothetical protein PLL64_13865 [Rhodothermales bacterium]|nr:hypothetical protein [Bacteroidota bacterium]HRK75364.1 hypothetical protein [Rhodothermales bacterium]HRR10235.1 hypothetical protein [Rhodothermales bacterium]